MTKEISYVAIALAIIAIATAAYTNVTQETTDTSDFASQDQIRALDQRISTVETARNLCDTDPECLKFFASRFLTEAKINPVINDIVAVTDKLQEEIIVNRDNFKDNHPFNFEPEELPVEGETEAFSVLLEITLEKENWLCGETVVFTGNAVSFVGQVRATVSEPDGNERYLNAIVYPSGEYRFSFGTPFDCKVGEHGVFVEQGHKKSQTVSFNLVVE